MRLIRKENIPIASEESLKSEGTLSFSGFQGLEASLRQFKSEFE
jgi:hypothetical protein